MAPASIQGGLKKIADPHPAIGGTFCERSLCRESSRDPRANHTITAYADVTKSRSQVNDVVASFRRVARRVQGYQRVPWLAVERNGAPAVLALAGAVCEVQRVANMPVASQTIPHLTAAISLARRPARTDSRIITRSRSGYWRVATAACVARICFSERHLACFPNPSPMFYPCVYDFHRGQHPA